MRIPATGNRKINKQTEGFCPKLFVLLTSFHPYNGVLALGNWPRNFTTRYFCLASLPVLPPILIIGNDSLMDVM